MRWNLEGVMYDFFSLKFHNHFLCCPSISLAACCDAFKPRTRRGYEDFLNSYVHIHKASSTHEPIQYAFWGFLLHQILRGNVHIHKVSSPHEPIQYAFLSFILHQILHGNVSHSYPHLNFQILDSVARWREQLTLWIPIISIFQILDAIARWREPHFVDSNHIHVWNFRV